MLRFCLETIKRKRSYLVPSSVSNRNGRDSSIVCLLSNQRDFILRGICLFSVFPKASVKCEVKRGKQRGCAEPNCELLTLSPILKLILDGVHSGTVYSCGTGWILGLAGVDASNN